MTPSISANGSPATPSSEIPLDRSKQRQHLAMHMTPEQAAAGRRSGVDHSIHARSIKALRAALEKLNVVARRLGIEYRLLAQSTATTATAVGAVDSRNSGCSGCSTATDEPQGVLVLSSLSSSSSGEEKTRDQTPFQGSSPARVRARRAPPTSATYDAHPGFLRFWSVWPKKVGKLEALDAWVRLNPDPELEDKIIAALKANEDNGWSGKDLNYLKDPCRWLKYGRWEDEIIAPKLTREQEMDREYQRLCKELEHG